jgi:iron complex outermembrane receptor protein
MLYDYSVPTPPFLYNEITANVGTMINRGLEMSAEGDAFKSKDFRWNLSGELNFTNTMVKKLSGTYDGYPLTANKIPLGYALGRGLSTAAITLLKPGYSPYVFYLPHYTGVDADGNQEFDGKTLKQNKHPKKYYIDPSEKFDYGLTNTFEYKNWSFSFFLRGVYGQKAFNNTLLDYESIKRLPGNNITKSALTNGIKDQPTVSDLWLENASYLRLDNASLGYSFKNIKGIHTFHIYVAANNIFVITKYRGIDPEIPVSDSDQSYIDANYDGNGYYPKTRSFIIGANVSFK